MYHIIEHPKSFVSIFPETYDKYALMHSSCFKSLIGDMEGIPEEEMEGILKITKGKKSIYRKYKARSIEGQNKYVSLSYRSIKQLGASPNDCVSVQKSWWLPYLWHYYDVTIRSAFKIGIIGIGINIVFSLISILIH